MKICRRSASFMKIRSVTVTLNLTTSISIHTVTDFGEIPYSSSALDIMKWSGSLVKKNRCRESRTLLEGVNDILRVIFYVPRHRICP